MTYYLKIYSNYMLLESTDNTRFKKFKYLVEFYVLGSKSPIKMQKRFRQIVR